MAKLSPKQQRFVEEYLIDLNATQAAIRAGYSPATANEQGSQNLAKLNVSHAISLAMAERSRRTGVNQDRVIQELAKIAFLNPLDVVNMDSATLNGEINRDDTAAIAYCKVKKITADDGDVVECEVKTFDKIKALELLGKHVGVFNDKLKIEGSIPVVISGDEYLED